MAKLLPVLIWKTDGMLTNPADLTKAIEKRKVIACVDHSLSLTVKFYNNVSFTTTCVRIGWLTKRY